MNLVRNAVLASLLVAPFMATAQDFPTVFPALGNENPTELDALTGRCSSDDGGETLDCLFITVILNRLETDEGTACRLWGTAGTQTLQRTGPGTWTHQTEPSGSCGVYNTVEFRCNPESLIQCEFFERSTYTVTTGERCEHYASVDDPGDHYSYRVSGPMDLTCDTVEFSYD